MLACARSYIEDESRLYEPVLLQLREKSNSMCLVRLAGALYWSHDDLLLQNLVAIVISRSTRIPIELLRPVLESVHSFLGPSMDTKLEFNVAHVKSSVASGKFEWPDPRASRNAQITDFTVNHGSNAMQPEWDCGKEFRSYNFMDSKPKFPMSLLLAAAAGAC